MFKPSPMPISTLCGEVEKYFFSQLDTFPTTTKFHFLSRLYLWDQRPPTRKMLDEMFETWAGKDPDETLLNISRKTEITSIAPMNAAHARAAYLERYPKLRIYCNVLSRINFLETAYTINKHHIFTELFDGKETDKYYEQLLNDPDALASLSTIAINFIYFYNRIVKKRQSPSDYLLSVGQNIPPPDSKEQIQLRIYYYTHCILGASDFYARSIDQQQTAVYMEMLHIVESLIYEHYDNIHLDNKYEFLVCARVLGYKSSVEQRIISETGYSLSPHGHFVIDVLNNNPQIDRITCITSEHRNALLLLSQSVFHPRDNS